MVGLAPRSNELQTSPRGAEPPPSLVVLSADAEGRQIVSVHVKRAYRLQQNGTCMRAEEAVPLLFSRDPVGDDDFGVPESDVIPFKQSTDLIVMAKAYASAGATSSMVTLRVRELERRHRVWGPRRCLYRGPGSWSFSAPERFESVPLTYAMAYGGVDPSYPMPEQVRIEQAFKLPCNAYPRNTVGMGYVVRESRERMSDLLLPQLENPADLLEPARLVAGEPEHWWRQPFPWSIDWFDGFWYPRSSFFGSLPDGLTDDDRALFEVRAGWIGAGQATRLRGLPPDERLDARFADAASPGLVLPFLSGNERIELDGVMPGGGSIRVQLPGDVPRVRLRHAGRDHELMAVPHRVLISTLEMGVYVVWHAAYYPPQALPLRHPTRATPQVPQLEGVDVTVDGARIPTADELEPV